MRFLTILMGALLIASGVGLVILNGVTFLSVAFVLGILYLVCGLIEVIAYRVYHAKYDEKTWILSDGITSIMTGSLLVFNLISSDTVAKYILAFWCLTVAARNVVKAWSLRKKKAGRSLSHFLISLFNFVAGAYVFFDGELLHLTSATLIGICTFMQGVDVVHIGTSLALIKPEHLKSKDDIIFEKAEKLRKAERNKAEAMQSVRDAKQELAKTQKKLENMVDPLDILRPEFQGKSTREYEKKAREDAKKKRAKEKLLAEKKKKEAYEKEAKNRERIKKEREQAKIDAIKAKEKAKADAIALERKKAEEAEKARIKAEKEAEKARIRALKEEEEAKKRVEEARLKAIEEAKLAKLKAEEEARDKQFLEKEGHELFKQYMKEARKEKGKRLTDEEILEVKARADRKAVRLLNAKKKEEAHLAMLAERERIIAASDDPEKTRREFEEKDRLEEEAKEKEAAKRKRAREKKKAEEAKAARKAAKAKKEQEEA